MGVTILIAIFKNMGAFITFVVIYNALPKLSFSFTYARVNYAQYEYMYIYKLYLFYTSELHDVLHQNIDLVLASDKHF